MAARHAWSGLQLDSGPGKPLTGGKINFWANGTTNFKDTFTDSGLGTPNANPVILSPTGVVPEVWSADTDVYAMQLLDSEDNVILATVQDIGFIVPPSVTSANVLAALDANAAAVVINGASMDGNAFANFVTDFVLTAAGTIDASAGAITLGTISGSPAVDTLLATSDDSGPIGASGTAFSDLFLASGAVINFNAGDVTLTHSANTLTVAGGAFAAEAFTSNGITDSASGERLLVSDGSVLIGSAVAASVATFANRVDDGQINIQTAGGSGARFDMYGDQHSTLANDFLFRNATDFVLLFDSSASKWDFQANAIATTNDILLGSGSILNFNAGDVTITHSANLLTVAGGDVAVDGFITQAGFVSTAKVSDTSRNTTTTLADDDELTGMSLAAGTYILDANLIPSSASATPDFKYRFSLTSGAVSFSQRIDWRGDNSPAFLGVAVVAYNSEGTLQLAAGVDVGLLIKGVITFSADSVIDFQWAQNVSDGTDVTLRGGSYVKFTKV